MSARRVRGPASGLPKEHNQERNDQIVHPLREENSTRRRVSAVAAGEQLLPSSYFTASRKHKHCYLHRRSKSFEREEKKGKEERARAPRLHVAAGGGARGSDEQHPLQRLLHARLPHQRHARRRARNVHGDLPKNRQLLLASVLGHAAALKVLPDEVAILAPLPLEGRLPLAVWGDVALRTKRVVTEEAQCEGSWEGGGVGWARECEG